MEIAGTTVPAGQRAQLEIPVARLPTGSEVSLPVVVVRGHKGGPTVWVSAALHGDELNGVEIVRRVLKRVLPGRLAGTLIAVPFVNVFGVINQSRYLPDRRDLNRCFPGSPRGSLAARLAHLFVTEVVERCQYGIDLHSGSNRRTNLPQIRADLDDAEARRCGRAFGAPAMVHARLRDGSLREAATRRGVHVLVYEAGEALRFDPWAIDAGVRGTLAVLAELSMCKAPEGLEGEEPVEIRHSRWVRAGKAGIFIAAVELGERVEKGATLGTITDAFGRNGLRVRCPAAGLVIGLATNPLAHRGDGLVHVGVPEGPRVRER